MARIRQAKQGNRRKAVGVVRVSTSKQDIGVAAQRSQLERWASNEGVELIAIFEDVGVSGTAPLAKRPGLQAAISALREHKAGLVVAVKRDRFARHRHTISEVEQAIQHAGGVIVTTDGINKGEDTEAEEISSAIEDLCANLEFRRIQIRNRERVRECKRRGCTSGGRLPYGFGFKEGGKTSQRTGKPIELAPEPHEQAVILRMMELRRDGQSLAAVAASLADEGLTTRTGGKWQPMTIKRIVDRAQG